jgi:Winged helix DNA-binding domain
LKPSALMNKRCRAQLLSGPPAQSALEVVQRLLAVQAQSTRGFRLALRARTVGTTATDVDRALSEEKSLVVSWLNRGTLHLVCCTDYWWLHALTAPQHRNANMKRLDQCGVSATDISRGVGIISEAVGLDGPLSREELRDRLTKRGMPTEGQALVHLLYQASLEGEIVRGPLVMGRHCFVSAEQWLGPKVSVDRDQALMQLATRYLEGHGPASERDLANWAGVGLTTARRAFSGIADEIVTSKEGLITLKSDERTPVPAPKPKLLGQFDPLLHGWWDRSPILADGISVVTTNGIFRAVVLLEGRAVGTWAMSDNALRLTIATSLSSTALQRVKMEASDISRFLQTAELPVTIAETTTS